MKQCRWEWTGKVNFNTECGHNKVSYDFTSTRNKHMFYCPYCGGAIMVRVFTVGGIKENGPIMVGTYKYDTLQEVISDEIDSMAFADDGKVTIKIKDTYVPRMDIVED